MLLACRASSWPGCDNIILSVSTSPGWEIHSLSTEAGLFQNIYYNDHWEYDIRRRNIKNTQNIIGNILIEGHYIEVSGHFKSGNRLKLDSKLHIYHFVGISAHFINLD